MFNTPFRKLKKEREHEELVIRFFAYGDGLDGYKDRPSEFLFAYAKRMNGVFSSDPALIEHYRNRFLRMVAFVQSVFPHEFR